MSSLYSLWLVNSFVDWLWNWQTLIGSIVGGLAGVAAALVVARSQRRREERMAAMLLTADLLEFLQMQIAYDELWAAEPTQEPHPVWLTHRLLYRWPPLSSEFHGAAQRVTLAAFALAAHLKLFRVLHREIGETVAELRRTADQRPTSDVVEERLKRARRLAWQFTRLAKHADCASALVDSLVYSRFAALNKIRRRLWRTAEEKACDALLTDGERESE